MGLHVDLPVRSTVTVHVVLATDTTYLPWCATTVRSCLDAAAHSDTHVHLIHDQPVDVASRDRLTAMVRGTGAGATWHEVHPDQLEMLPSKGDHLGGRTSWIRVLIPEILAELDRAIYLDADVLVLDSLEPLWGADLSRFPIAAVANVVAPDHYPHVRSLGLDPRGDYFNAGVLVMDLAAMRREGTVSSITDYVAEHGTRLAWFDQDALNVAFAGRWHHLHPRWNTQNSLRTWSQWSAAVFGPEARAEALANPAILHFEGPPICKPWHLLCDHPSRDRYLRTLARTPWAAQPVEGATPLNRMISRLPPNRRVPAYVRTVQARMFAARVRRRIGAVESRRPPRRA
jgi:lipopolysaccharide biosynthesis glycosyltransferase